jgi:hypothetical protein
MSISYPLAYPTHTGATGFDLRATNAVAYSRSPFTFAGQAFAYPGQMWQADVSLPPMRRAAAEQWVAWLVSLRGSYGTFLLGNPMCDTIRGTATSATVTGTAQSNSITVTMTGTLLAGDMIQIGTGSDATLHKVLVDRSGSGTLEIWPALRKDRTDVALTLTAPRGVFRLASNETSWGVNESAIYGISFSAMEAV